MRPGLVGRVVVDAESRVAAEPAARRARAAQGRVLRMTGLLCSN